MGSYLVTGGAGFIGSHIVSALVARGDRVRVLDSLVTGHRKNLAPFDGKIEFIEGGLVNPHDVERAVAGSQEPVRGGHSKVHNGNAGWAAAHYFRERSAIARFYLYR